MNCFKMYGFYLMLTLIICARSFNWPDRCMDITSEMPNASDGEYCLKVSQGTETYLVEIYCSSMSANPQEFITLLAGEEENYSKTSHRYELVLTGDRFFSKVALDVEGNLMVQSDDYTFSRIENENGQELLAGSPAWGKAWSCNKCTDTSVMSEASIDLTGTVFQLPTDISYTARGADGCIKEMFYSDSFQTVKATCGGDCGGCLPRGVTARDTKIPLVINSSLSASNCISNHEGDIEFSGHHNKLHSHHGFLKLSANLLHTITSVFKPYVLNSITIENKVNDAYIHCPSKIRTGCTALPYKPVVYDMTSILDNLSVWVYKFINVKPFDICYTEMLLINVEMVSLGNQVFRCYIL